jgi:hypothetical protein
MVRSQPAMPSPLTLPLLAASTSSSNWRAPPSMVPPSLHRHPVASLPLSTNKRCPGRTSPRRTPHHPHFLLSCVGARPTTRLQQLSRCLIAWSPHRHSPFGEALNGSPVLHFPSPAPWTEAMVVGPSWTEVLVSSTSRQWSLVHRGPRFRWSTACEPTPRDFPIEKYSENLYFRGFYRKALVLFYN